VARSSVGCSRRQGANRRRSPQQNGLGGFLRPQPLLAALGKGAALKAWRAAPERLHAALLALKLASQEGWGGCKGGGRGELCEEGEVEGGRRVLLLPTCMSLELSAPAPLLALALAASTGTEQGTAELTLAPLSPPTCPVSPALACPAQA
jgi:hypothetical protein